MSYEDDILKAYHRAVFRRKERTGESYPLVRTSCIREDGTIVDTSVYSPKIYARWREDARGRYLIRLLDWPFKDADPEGC